LLILKYKKSIFICKMRSGWHVGIVILIQSLILSHLEWFAHLMTDAKGFLSVSNVCEIWWSRPWGLGNNFRSFILRWKHSLRVLGHAWWHFSIIVNEDASHLDWRSIRIEFIGKEYSAEMKCEKSRAIHR
jgi:hypothetical protein